MLGHRSDEFYRGLVKYHLSKSSRTLQKYSKQREEQSDKYDCANDEYDFTEYIRDHQVGGMYVVLVSHSCTLLRQSRQSAVACRHPRTLSDPIYDRSVDYQEKTVRDDRDTLQSVMDNSPELTGCPTI